MSPARKAALLLSADYSPSTEVASRRMAAFARVLRDAGMDVYVVSAFGGARIAQLEEIEPQVYAVPVAPPRNRLINALRDLRRLLGTSRAAAPSNGGNGDAVAPRLRAGLVTRIISALDIIDSYKMWSLRACLAALRISRHREIALVVASGPPYSVLVAASVVARRRGIRCLLDCRDPLPSSGAGGAKAGALATWIEQRVERHMVVSTDRLTCVSPGLTAALRAKYSPYACRISNIPNGFDGAPQLRSPDTGHRLTIVFAGALYANRNADVLLRALPEFLARPGVDRDRIRLRFIGARPSIEWTQLRRAVARSGCADVVEILGFMDPAELAEHLRDATVLLNLAQHQPIQVPAKSYEHIASGCEVLTLCEQGSDTANMLASIRGAHVVGPDDTDQMIATLEDLYRRHVETGRLRALDTTEVDAHSREHRNRLLSDQVQYLLTPTRRILYVESSIDGTVGGSHVSLHYLAGGIKAKGFEPVVVFSAPHGMMPQYQALGIEIHVLRASRADFSGARNRLEYWVRRITNSIVVRIRGLVAIGRFHALLRRERIELIHMNNSMFDASFEWFVAAKLRGIPCVAHERGWPAGIPYLQRRTARYYDTVICISNAVRTKLQSLGLGPMRYLTVHNGIDVGKARPLQDPSTIRSEFGIAPQRPVLGVVGNIQPWKGQDVVIRAVARIRQEFPDISCLIIGDVAKSQDRDVAFHRLLKQLVAENGLDGNVYLAGYRKDVVSYMNAMDIVLHSSVDPEPFGRVLVEAMAVRKPLVAAGAGGVPEIVLDGVTGFLYTPGDPVAMADKIAQLLRDRDLQRAMGERGHERVAEVFDISRNTNSIFDLYCRLLKLNR